MCPLGEKTPFKRYSHASSPKEQQRADDTCAVGGPGVPWSLAREATAASVEDSATASGRVHRWSGFSWRQGQGPGVELHHQAILPGKGCKDQVPGGYLHIPSSHL